MRKSTLLLISGGCLFAATAAWAADKKDDGPGMTMSQKMGTLFGLVDGAAGGAPPPPPGMPAMGKPGTVRLNPSGSAASAGTGFHRPTTTNQRSAAATPKSVPNYVAADPSLPQPPQPQRTAASSGSFLPPPAGATPAAAPLVAARPQTSNPAGQTSTQPRTSIVGASKQPLFTTQPTVKPALPTTAPTAAAAPAFMAAKTVGSSRRRPTTEEPTAAAATPATTPIPTPIPMSKPIPVNQPDAPAVSTAPASPGSEPFTPSLPQFAPAPVAAPAASVASSASPNVVPPLPIERSASAPIPVNQPETAVAAPPAPIAESRPDVLAAHTSPELTLETIGPRTAAVGREARYRVLLRNRGTVEARDVVVLLEVPAHAEIAELHGTTGSSTSADEFAAGKPLTWQLSSVPAQSQEELTLVLVPRKSDALELGVRWTSSTPTARATVEVQEPKLTLAISGPNEVAYGEQRLYKLTVSNPGNGPAENVVLQLMPLNPADGSPLSHVVGNLRPGESNSIEVELTARQAGMLSIRTSATAEGNLKAEASADVTVRRANLDVVTSAPRILFAGVPGTYEVRVRNTGDEAARNVRVTVELPTIAKLLDTTPSLAAATGGGPLTWTFERIAPGSEQVCTVKCAWDGMGRQQVTATAVADGDLRKSAVAATEVQAVADLTLDVVDMAGPAPVDRPVTYEIRVKNRGLKSAEGVDVVAYFSDGIEPEKAEGHAAELQPGMVIFRTLPSVGPGQEWVLKVTARAQKQGNHRLRVELQSASPQTELSHEDAKFFYVDDPQAASPAPAAGSPGTFHPQPASPIGQTSASAPLGTPKHTAAPISPNYRINDLR